MDETDLHAFEEEIRGRSRWLSTSDRGAVLVVEVVDAFEILNRAVAAAVDAERAETKVMQDLVERSVRLLRHVYGSQSCSAICANEYVEAAELALRVAASTTPTDPPGAWDDSAASPSDPERAT